MATFGIRITGLVEALRAVDAVGEAGKQVNGPIATFASLLPYAYGIETGRHRGGRLARRAGGAYMFRRGIDEVKAQAPAILGPAILKGPASVGQAKRKLRDLGIERIRSYTPVRSGRLRTSVQVLERLG